MLRLQKASLFPSTIPLTLDSSTENGCGEQSDPQLRRHPARVLQDHAQEDPRHAPLEADRGPRQLRPGPQRVLL